MSLCDELEARQEKRRDRILQLGEVATSQLLTPSTPEAFNQHWQGICDNFDLLYSTPENVSQLRQAILQLAVMGKLVPQDPNDEPASVLLERIREEKARLVKEGKIKKSEKLPLIRADEVPLIRADEVPFELPDTWQWVCFGEILLEITSGWSPMCEKHPKEDEEWGVLKVSAVSWDKFNPDENKALPSNLKPRPEHEVRAGNFLMSRANTSALVGKSVIVENTPERLLLSDKILRVYFSTFADKKFFNIYNNSLAARAYYSKEASGTSDSMRNISRIQILNLPVPVPPFQEQKRIFVKINQFMSLCDELEAKLTQSISDRGKLMEAAVRQVLAA
jgi:type I restriction enzyme S subunit